MKNITIATILISVLFMTNSSLANTMTETTNTCSICDHTFTCILDASGYQSGMRLDLKPLGPTPAPWRVPVCPECHFVIYDKEIPDEELVLCRAIIAKDEYKKYEERSSYFLMGLLFEGLDKGPDTIGHTFLKASWQEEKNEKMLKEDMERSLKNFELFLAKEESIDDEGYSTAQLLKGELLRRLGRFEESSVYLKGIKDNKAFQEGILKNVIMYEIRLCDQRDSDPHAISEAE